MYTIIRDTTSGRPLYEIGLGTDLQQRAVETDGAMIGFDTFLMAAERLALNMREDGVADKIDMKIRRQLGLRADRIGRQFGNGTCAELTTWRLATMEGADAGKCNITLAGCVLACVINPHTPAPSALNEQRLHRALTQLGVTLSETVRMLVHSWLIEYESLYMLAMRYKLANDQQLTDTDRNMLSAATAALDMEHGDVDFVQLDPVWYYLEAAGFRQ